MFFERASWHRHCRLESLTHVVPEFGCSRGAHGTTNVLETRLWVQASGDGHLRNRKFPNAHDGDKSAFLRTSSTSPVGCMLCIGAKQHSPSFLLTQRDPIIRF